jgi:triosephosphate isomerase
VFDRKLDKTKEEKDNKEDKDNEFNIKYCPTNATFTDILMKPLTKANILKINKMIKSIIGQQECVGLNNKTVPVQYGTATNNSNIGAKMHLVLLDSFSYQETLILQTPWVSTGEIPKLEKA